jgi:hypothetical protein
MLLQQLFERVMLDHPGSNRVIDLRTGKTPNQETHVVLTKDHGAIIFAYPGGSFNHGKENRIPWSTHDDPGQGEGVMQMVRREMDTSVQDDTLMIRFTPKGVQIGLWREGPSWNGNRNRYSEDIRTIVARLLDLDIVNARTPVFVGNWARRDEDGDLMGSVSAILNTAQTPSRLILYHGTSNARAKVIMEEGLAPLSASQRVWNKDKNSPDHRADCIYLTASRNQADYYARKATQVDRRRLSYHGWATARGNEGFARNSIPYAKTDKERAKWQDKLEKATRAKEIIEKLRGHADKIEPVILQIVLPRREFKHLFADDDYMGKMARAGTPADPRDWRHSLSDFAQIAYQGTIPPEMIQIIT